MNKFYYRPYETKNSDGLRFTSARAVQECTCSDRRGPKGGVCGCGNAIPSESEIKEVKALEEKIRQDRINIARRDSAKDFFDSERSNYIKNFLRSRLG
jgi:hypothetical protein